MKKIFILPTVVAFAMICSCQKHDSATEQQLAQRKVELDARETALAEKEKELNLKETALNERQNALAKKEKAGASARIVPPDVQSQGAVRDAAEAKAERDRRIQQLPPEIRALIPDPSRMKSAREEKDRITRERLAKKQAVPEQLQSQNQQKGTSPTSSPAIETTSPAESPTPQ